MTRHIQTKVSWCILFVDDIVLVVSKVDINEKLELCQNTLESRDFRLSTTKLSTRSVILGKKDGGPHYG